MRHYSHLARDRMQRATAQVPLEFGGGEALDQAAQKELHAAIGGGPFTRRLADFSQGLVFEDSDS